MKRRKTTLPRLAVYAMSKAELVRLLNAAEAFPTLVRALEETLQELRKKSRRSSAASTLPNVSTNGTASAPSESKPGK